MGWRDTLVNVDCEEPAADVLSLSCFCCAAKFGKQESENQGTEVSGEFFFSSDVKYFTFHKNYVPAYVCYVHCLKLLQRPFSPAFRRIKLQDCFPLCLIRYEKFKSATFLHHPHKANTRVLRGRKTSVCLCYS